MIVGFRLQMLRLLEPEQAFGELGLNRHSIRFSSCVQLNLPGMPFSKTVESVHNILSA